MTKRSEEARQKKEKLEEELKASQLEEEKAKKKEGANRQKERKKEEAERRRAEDEAEAAQEAKRSAKVRGRKAEEDSKMKEGEDEGKAEEEGRMEVDEEEQAAEDDEESARKKARKVRKQQRREKQGNRRQREADAAAAAATGATDLPTLPPAGVRKIHSKYSPRKALFKEHKHVHSREFTTASCLLSQDDKYSEFTIKVRALLAEGQKVDEFFAIETIEGGNNKRRWETPAQVQFNFTEMGENIQIPENAKFEQVNPWGKNATKTDGTKAAPQDPEVCFTFCSSCDKDPESILQRVRPEWRRQVPGQDTSIYDDWHWRDANKRKAIHIERAEENVQHLQTLVEIAKRRKSSRCPVGQAGEAQQRSEDEEEREEARGRQGPRDERP